MNHVYQEGNGYIQTGSNVNGKLQKCGEIMKQRNFGYHHNNQYRLNIQKLI
mgnify:CR=1 FL=1